MTEAVFQGRIKDPQQGHQVIKSAWEWAKAMTMAGNELSIKIAKQKRSLDQNAKFHAMCTDIAKAGIQWAGKPRSAEEWKVLLVSGHSAATRHEVEVVPGLEGEFVAIRESTASMSKERSSSLIEYTLAFGAAHGVKFSASEHE